MFGIAFSHATAEGREGLRQVRNQLRASRYLLNLTMAQVHNNTGLAIQTINQMENIRTYPDTKVSKTTLLALARYYESLGAEFRPDGWVRVIPRTKETPND